MESPFAFDDPNLIIQYLDFHSPPIPFSPDPPFGFMTLTEEEQRLMFERLRAIFTLAQQNEGSSGLELGETPPQAKTAAALKDVRSILDQLWWSKSQYLLQTAEVLANGSRDPDWRKPYGQSGILHFFLGVVGTQGAAVPLRLHALRLIGNSCADTDDNRAIVVNQNYLPAVIRQVNQPQLVKIAVPVLFNICIDYEPAQQKAVSDGICKALLNLVSEPGLYGRDGSAWIGYVCKIFDLVLGAENAKSKFEDQSATILLRIAVDQRTDFDDFLSLVNTSVALLEEERSQKALIGLQGVEQALAVLVESYSRFTDGAEPQGVLDEDRKLLSQMRNMLIQSLSDVSALPEFAIMYPLNSRLIGSLRMWLKLPHTQLQVCACIMLGNLARTDDVCRTFVREYKLHEPLKILLDEAKDSQVLHAVAGILKNLALLTENKSILGDCGLLESTSRIWNMDHLPQVQYAGVALARPLLSGPFNTIRRLLTPLSPDPDSPAHSRTYLSLLLTVYSKTDSVPIKTEISRSVTAILRVLNLEKSDFAEVNRLTEVLFKLHPTVVGPVNDIVIQSTYPVVRSEGWFALALMAKNPLGASVVANTLQGETLGALVDVLAKGVDGGRSPSVTSALSGLSGSEARTPQSAAAETKMATIDRENALIMLSEMLRNNPDFIINPQPLFQELLESVDPRSVYERYTAQDHSSLVSPISGPTGRGVIADEVMSFMEPPSPSPAIRRQPSSSLQHMSEEDHREEKDDDLEMAE